MTRQRGTRHPVHSVHSRTLTAAMSRALGWHEHCGTSLYLMSSSCVVLVLNRSHSCACACGTGAPGYPVLFAAMFPHCRGGFSFHSLTQKARRDCRCQVVAFRKVTGSRWRLRRMGIKVAQAGSQVDSPTPGPAQAGQPLPRSPAGSQPKPQSRCRVPYLPRLPWVRQAPSTPCSIYRPPRRHSSSRGPLQVCQLLCLVVHLQGLDEDLQARGAAAAARQALRRKPGTHACRVGGKAGWTALQAARGVKPVRGRQHQGSRDACRGPHAAAMPHTLGQGAAGAHLQPLAAEHAVHAVLGHPHAVVGHPPLWQAAGSGHTP